MLIRYGSFLPGIAQTRFIHFRVSGRIIRQRAISLECLSTGGRPTRRACFETQVKASMNTTLRCEGVSNRLAGKNLRNRRANMEGTRLKSCLRTAQI